MFWGSLGSGTAPDVAQLVRLQPNITVPSEKQQGGLSPAPEHPQSCLGMGTAQSCSTAELPLSPGSRSSRTAELSRPLHFDALMFKKNLAVPLLKIISLLAEQRRSFPLHFCQETIGVSGCIMSHHLVKHELTYCNQKVFEHIMSETGSRNAASCSLCLGRSSCFPFLF